MPYDENGYIPMNMNDRVRQAVEDSDSYNAFSNYIGYAQAPYPLMFWALCICGEAGELANKIKKYTRGSVPFEEIHPQAVSELVDVMVYCYNMAAALEIDLEKEYDDKIRYNRERFRLTGPRADDGTD